MDRAYVELSYKTGLLAGRVDEYLGWPCFVPIARALCWSLTPDVLDELERRARDLGIPPDVTAFTAEDAAAMPHALDIAEQAQRRADAWSGFAQSSTVH